MTEETTNIQNEEATTKQQIIAGVAGLVTGGLVGSVASYWVMRWTKGKWSTWALIGAFAFVPAGLTSRAFFDYMGDTEEEKIEQVQEKPVERGYIPYEEPEVEVQIDDITSFHERLNGNNMVIEHFDGQYADVIGQVDKVTSEGRVLIRGLNDSYGLGGRVYCDANGVPRSTLLHVQEGDRVQAFGELKIKNYVGPHVELERCRLHLTPFR